MLADIFDAFGNSIEQVKVRKTKRGAIDDEVIYTQTLDAIVKRRDTMITETENSEDRNSQTTIHFKPADKQYIQLGNFVEIDSKWRSIVSVVDGYDFDEGELKFVRTEVGNDIVEPTADPDWGVSA